MVWVNQRKTLGLIAAMTPCLLLAPGARADQVTCSIAAYKAQAGLAAAMDGAALVVTWSGDGDQEVRLRLAVNGGTPTIEDLALRHGTGAWTTVARNAVPDYAVTTGLRRMSNQQLEPLRGLGVKMTQDELNKYRWDPFWDAPLDLSTPRAGANGAFANNPPPVEGLPDTDQPGLPRKPDEIQKATATYAVDSCAVASDGARLTVTYPGVKLGVFDGSLQFTVFKGTNLIRQEVVASTKASWVAYKYDAGLKGLAIAPGSRAVWRDLEHLAELCLRRAGQCRGRAADRQQSRHSCRTRECRFRRRLSAAA